jgi:hypothetical protein
LVNEVVIVALSGQLVACGLVTGTWRWVGPGPRRELRLAHLLTIDGFAQILRLGETGATSVALAVGTLLWEHPWRGYPSCGRPCPRTVTS